MKASTPIERAPVDRATRRSVRWRRWLLGLALALTPGLSPWAAAQAEEYKVVLAPEAGQGPPARVCLVSRNRQMKADRAAGLVAALADRVVCADGGCTAQRDTRPARCTQCPDAPHPGCQATLDLGDRTLDDYSVVCADDDTSPDEGGTVYISIESVEAENSPRFYSFEVSGGRVRWSPFEPITRPSYRVLGGDFESARFSYPRVPSDQPWAEVPVRRRCRCLDARISRGVGAVSRVLLDEAAACRGDVSVDGLLPVEVPAVARDRVLGLHINAAQGDLGARWSSRWPPVPIESTPRRFGFEWTMPCIWPRHDLCPTVNITGATCTGAAPSAGRCVYSCEVLADGAVSPPLLMHLHIDDPSIELTEILGAVGQTVVGRVPSDARVVWADVSDWQRDVPGDRIRAIRVLAVDGTRLTIELTAQDSDRVTVPLPGARCGTSLRTELIGERDYEAGYGRIAEGAQLNLPAPRDLVVPWQVIFGLGGGAMVILAVEDGETVNATLSYAIIDTIGVRLRAPATSWFIEPQLVGMLVGDWPYNPLDAEGGGTLVQRHHYAALGGELGVGYTAVLGGRTFHFHAGLGGGVSFDPFFESQEVVEQGREMGMASIGMSTALTTAIDSPFAIRIDLRHWFGSRSLRFTSDDALAVVRHAEPAHALLLTATLTAAP